MMSTSQFEQQRHHQGLNQAAFEAYQLQHSQQHQVQQQQLQQQQHYPLSAYSNIIQPLPMQLLYPNYFSMLQPIYGNNNSSNHDMAPTYPPPSIVQILQTTPKPPLQPQFQQQHSQQYAQQAYHQHCMPLPQPFGDGSSSSKRNSSSNGIVQAIALTLQPPMMSPLQQNTTPISHRSCSYRSNNSNSNNMSSKRQRSGDSNNGSNDTSNVNINIRSISSVHQSHSNVGTPQFSFRSSQNLSSRSSSQQLSNSSTTSNDKFINNHDINDNKNNHRNENNNNSSDKGYSGNSNNTYKHGTASNNNSNNSNNSKSSNNLNIDSVNAIAPSHDTISDTTPSQLARRRHKHQLVEVKRRARLGLLFEALTEACGIGQVDKASLLTEALRIVKQHNLCQQQQASNSAASAHGLQAIALAVSIDHDTKIEQTNSKQHTASGCNLQQKQQQHCSSSHNNSQQLLDDAESMTSTTDDEFSSHTNSSTTVSVCSL